MKLDEIASEISSYLQKFERDKTINKYKDGREGTSPYYYASAWRAGSYVSIRYISYQCESKLRKAEALAYLEWLRAGNVGKHFDPKYISRNDKPIQKPEATSAPPLEKPADKYGRLRQDDSCHWYLVPESLVDRFDQLQEMIDEVGGDYLANAQLYDDFESELGSYRIDGVTDLKVEMQ